MKIETKFDIGERVFYPFLHEKGERCCECETYFTKNKYLVKSGKISAVKIYNINIIGYIIDAPCFPYVVEDEISAASEEARMACAKLNQVIYDELDKEVNENENRQ